MWKFLCVVESEAQLVGVVQEDLFLGCRDLELGCVGGLGCRCGTHFGVMECKGYDYNASLPFIIDNNNGQEILLYIKLEGSCSSSWEISILASVNANKDIFNICLK